MILIMTWAITAIPHSFHGFFVTIFMQKPVTKKKTKGSIKIHIMQTSQKWRAQNHYNFNRRQEIKQALQYLTSPSHSPSDSP